MNYLKAYQAKLGLDADGKIGPNTAKAMMADLAMQDKLFFAHCIGQMAHESGGFTYGRENLNYDAEGLANTWARYSATGVRRGPPNALAQRLSRKPQAIGNDVYANRMGNGDVNSGDGWKYRGIFGLQLTGKTNIQKFIAWLGLPLGTDPDSLLADPKIYFQAGVFWFIDNGVDKLCTSTSEECITKISKRVNGGTHGLDDRKIQTRKVFKALGL